VKTKKKTHFLNIRDFVQNYPIEGIHYHRHIMNNFQKDIKNSNSLFGQIEVLFFVQSFN
jgi:hypothetical protein